MEAVAMAKKKRFYGFGVEVYHDFTKLGLSIPKYIMYEANNISFEADTEKIAEEIAKKIAQRNGLKIFLCEFMDYSDYFEADAEKIAEHGVHYHVVLGRDYTNKYYGREILSSPYAQINICIHK